MKLTVPTTFSDRFLNTIIELNHKYAPNRVVEFYGSLPSGVIGNQRVSSEVPNIDLGTLATYISKARSHGIEFNYTLNTSCLGNIEFFEQSRSRLFLLLDQLVDAGVRRFSVALPPLISLIRRHYKDVEVLGSTVAFITSVKEALYYQDELHVARLILAKEATRNFPLIKALRKYTHTPLEILVNTECLLKCPMHFYHRGVTSHASQQACSEVLTTYDSRIPHIPCVLYCIRQRLDDFSELIKSNWVRPQDCSIYENLGVEYFKIAGRDEPEPVILYRTEAYLKGYAQGNFYKLTTPMWDYLPLIAQILGHKPLPSLNLSMEITELDGVISYILNRDRACEEGGGCQECRFCNKVAGNVVKADMEKKQMYIQKSRELEKIFWERDLPKI